MKEVDIVSKIVNREGGTFVPSSKGTQPIDLSDYLLKSIWDKVWEIRTDSQGTEYIFGKLPMVTQYGITMYSGDGVDIPSLASGLPFDGRTIWYNPETNQIEVIGGGSGGGGTADSVAWANITGKPTWIGSSKPTYSYSEITGAISTTELQNYLTSNSYLNITSGDNRYLKLSGGIISGGFGALDIKRNESAKPSLIKFTNNDGTLGMLGMSDNYEPIVYKGSSQSNPNTIWHSGNDGSGSGLDADLLDGKHADSFMNFNANTTYVGASMGNDNLSKLASGDGHIEFWDNAGGWFNGKWGKLIAVSGFEGSLSGNASSATKLQTARTIWGQSFDGTGNVSGDISNTSSIAFDTSAGAPNIGYLWTNTRGMHMDMSGLGTELQGANLTLTPSGNVGIGTASPSTKLHVSGDILATGAMTFYSMRKLKNVVDERGLSLSELSTIKPTRYTWKDGRDNRLHIGGIADDIQQVLPEVVYKTSDGILTMDYGNAAFAIASSLIKPVIDHEKRIAMLEAENKQLRQEVERLKRVKWK